MLNEEKKRILTWLNNQRSACKRNRQLNEYRNNKLSKIAGFDWMNKKTNNESWLDNYNVLKSFIEKNNRYPNQHSDDTTNKKLGIWIRNQKAYKKNNKLSEDRINLLQQLPNWRWDLDEKWLETYNRLKQFVESNNKFPSQCAKKIEEKQLGKWIDCQRQAKSNKGGRKITEDRIALLERLSDWKWDASQKR